MKRVVNFSLSAVAVSAISFRGTPAAVQEQPPPHQEGQPADDKPLAPADSAQGAEKHKELMARLAPNHMKVLVKVSEDPAPAKGEKKKEEKKPEAIDSKEKEKAQEDADEKASGGASELVKGGEGEGAGGGFLLDAKKCEGGKCEEKNDAPKCGEKKTCQDNKAPAPAEPEASAKAPAAPAEPAPVEKKKVAAVQKEDPAPAADAPAADAPAAKKECPEKCKQFEENVHDLVKSCHSDNSNADGGAEHVCTPHKIADTLKNDFPGQKDLIDKCADNCPLPPPKVDEEGESAEDPANAVLAAEAKTEADAEKAKDAAAAKEDAAKGSF